MSRTAEEEQDLGTHIELIAVHILEVEGDGVLPRLGLVHITYPVGSQVYLTILMVWEFVFPVYTRLVNPVSKGEPGDVEGLVLLSPLIQPHIVLHEEQVLIGQV
jgi:hypothetical protein